MVLVASRWLTTFHTVFCLGCAPAAPLRLGRVCTRSIGGDSQDFMSNRRCSFVSQGEITPTRRPYGY